jgi:hypothetical protein
MIFLILYALAILALICVLSVWCVWRVCLLLSWYWEAHHHKRD